MIASRVVPAAVVVLGLAALYGLAMASHPLSVAAGQATAPLRAVPVTAVERGCPGLGLAGGASGRVALIAAAGSSGTGKAMATSLADAAAGHPLLSATQPGQLSLGTVRPAGGKVPAVLGAAPPASGQAVASVPLQGGVLVKASGMMARGLEVEQTGPTGIPSAQCTAPGTDFWFIGPGQHSIGRIQLYLMNPTGQAADVTVEIATDAGPLQGSTDTGIAVAPHSMVVQSLAPAVRGSRVVSLHVRTSVGQVVAAVKESTGTSGGGWLPISETPASRLVIPGLPAAAGTRHLFLTVPGEHDAHITIAAVTSHGSYEPTGGGGIDVPGGSAIAVDLPSMAGIPAALTLASSVPITASLMLPGGPPGAPGAFTAAAPPLQEQGVIATDLASGSGSSALVLSAPKGHATVRVTEVAGKGAPPAKVVQVSAGKSKLVQLAPVPGAPHGQAFSVVVTPLAGSGPVYAGRVILGAGTVQSLMPVSSALTTVPLPQVRAASITSRP
jgi:hypothetical protein